ncbi:MAG TPA: energy transducer TonB [Geobacter anodireducens]|nr:energy transducer TonB [Geobacter anodireducens]
MDQLTQTRRSDAPMLWTIALSLALHGALYSVTSLLPRHVAGVEGMQVVSVDLSGSEIRPVAPSPPDSLPAPVPEPVVASDMSLPVENEQPPAEEAAPPPRAVEPPPSPMVQAPPSPLSLGMSRGFFRGIAEGESLRSDVREYYFTLLETINERWWTVASASGMELGRSEAMLTIVMKKSGEMVDVQLVKSTGSPAYDRLILQAVQAANPLPPLPDSYTSELFLAPVRLVAPRGLLFS